MRTFLKWALGAILAVAFVILAATGWFFYVNTIVATPTCISFMASGTVEAKDRVSIGLEHIAQGAKLPLKAKFEERTEWESLQASVDFYSHRNSGNYSIFVCSEKYGTRTWQEVAAQVERTVRENAATASATLQLDPHDFKCNPQCAFSVPMPIDFRKLNRTVSAPIVAPGR